MAPHPTQGHLAGDTPRPPQGPRRRTSRRASLCARALRRSSLLPILIAILIRALHNTGQALLGPHFVPVPGCRVVKVYPHGILGPTDDQPDSVRLFKVASLAFTLPLKELQHLRLMRDERVPKLLTYDAGRRIHAQQPAVSF